VKPYSVVGTSEDKRQQAPPISTTVMVDPADVSNLASTLSGGGASGAIYKLLGKAYHNKPTPPEVRVQNITEGKAGYWRYGNKHHVIHTVGPNFSTTHRRIVDAEQTKPLIARAYVSVVSTWLRNKTLRGTTLRLIPISGSIFAGRFKPQMPRIQTELLTQPFVAMLEDEMEKSMDDIVTQINIHGRIEFCLFKTQEYRDYKNAIDSILRQ